MLSDVLRRQIDYDDSPETWRSLAGPRYKVLFGDHGEEYFLAFYHFEQTHEFSVRNSNVLETLLARPPTSLRACMRCNADAVLPRTPLDCCPGGIHRATIESRESRSDQ